MEKESRNLKNWDSGSSSNSLSALIHLKYTWSGSYNIVIVCDGNLALNSV